MMIYVIMMQFTLHTNPYLFLCRCFGIINGLLIYGLYLKKGYLLLICLYFIMLIIFKNYYYYYHKYKRKKKEHYYFYNTQLTFMGIFTIFMLCLITTTIQDHALNYIKIKKDIYRE
jgi:hypothetical protein